LTTARRGVRCRGYPGAAAEATVACPDRRCQPVLAREVVMRRSVLVLAASVVAALLLAGALSMIRLGTAPAAAKESLTLIEHVTNETVVDLGEEGDTTGDTLVFHNELYDDTDANLVGNSNGSCIRTAVGELWECTFTNTMEQGSLVVQGPFNDNGTGTFAITGGTGEYSGATGQMTLTAAEDSTADSPKWEFAFEIN
jgi:allene oxide cyclase